MTYKQKTQIVATSMSVSAALILITQESNQSSRSQADDIQCVLDATIDENFLTQIDEVARDSESNVACIKARFALSIKFEEVVPLAPSEPHPNGTDTYRAVLGYLPLEQVISVENSCPDKSSKTTNKEGSNGAENQKKEVSNTNGTQNGKVEPDKADTDDDEQEMIVTFSCGKLAFTFKRDDKHTFVSSIKGVIKLDSTVREFISNKPVFVTSDLDHHFKYVKKIEVTSEAPSKLYVLTANFFFTEIEAFRKTTSRDFTLPPDENSKPYLDEQLTETPITAVAQTTTRMPSLST